MLFGCYFIRHLYSEKRANGRCDKFVTPPTDKCVSAVCIHRDANKKATAECSHPPWTCLTI